MSWKYIFPLLASVLRRKASAANVADSTRTILKEVLHEEVLSLIVKIMFGLIVTAVVIMSLIFVGQQINRIFLGWPEGPTLSILVFGVLAVGGISILYYNFYQKKSPIEEAQEDLNRLQVSKLASNFLEGLKQGAESASAHRHRHRQEPVATAPVYRPEPPPVDIPKVPDMNPFQSFPRPTGL